jgi:hypothetical protein
MRVVCGVWLVRQLSMNLDTYVKVCLDVVESLLYVTRM